MGIIDTIEREYNQKCVYWGNPLNDGQGGHTFDAPVELDCRWEEMNQVVTDNKGNEVTSRAVVFLPQDVDYEGMLYFGTLDSLYDVAGESSAGQLDEPRTFFAEHPTIPIYTIKRFQKVPVLGSTTEYLKKAYLTPSLSFGGF
jgi:hypothetical protein